MAVSGKLVGQLFGKASIHVSGLVAYHNGTIRPFNLVAPLKNPEPTGQQVLHVAQPLIDSANLFIQDNQPTDTAVQLMPMPELDKELDFIDKLSHLWLRLMTYLEHTASWSLLFTGFLLSFCFWGFLMAKRRYYG